MTTSLLKEEDDLQLLYSLRDCQYLGHQEVEGAEEVVDSPHASCQGACQIRTTPIAKSAVILSTSFASQQGSRISKSGKSGYLIVADSSLSTVMTGDILDSAVIPRQMPLVMQAEGFRYCAKMLEFPQLRDFVTLVGEAHDFPHHTIGGMPCERLQV